MELNNQIKILLKKIDRQGKENIAAAFLLMLLIGIGFFAVLWRLQSYSEIGRAHV